ncbi:MAG: CotH kinase family protein [Clostridia bacterium]|nr:CotH kinase family protein [Clostridia bacterium]
MSFGAGRGNGRDFDMDEMDFKSDDDKTEGAEVTAKAAEGSSGEDAKDGEMPQPPEGMEDGEMPQPPEGMEDGEMPQMPEGMENGEMPQMPGNNASGAAFATSGAGMRGGPGGGPGGGMGSDDVKLKYINDDVDSYSNIFENAKTNVSKADKTRLIGILKTISSCVAAGTEASDTEESAADGKTSEESGLNVQNGGTVQSDRNEESGQTAETGQNMPDAEGGQSAVTVVNSDSSSTSQAALEDIAVSEIHDRLAEVIETDEVLRYFVVHNFLCNGDSYTGQMIHNYYLYEEDGKLSMIPWDYNLAFGTFRGGDASSSVNESIDNPLSGADFTDRPLLGWIFSDEEYTKQYHELFSSFIEKWYSDGKLEQLIADTADMIRPYVEKDPTKFCTAEDFEKGVTAIKSFVSLRCEAVQRQLAGDSTAVDASGLNISDMGNMGNGGGPGGMGNPADEGKDGETGSADASQSAAGERTARSNSRGGEMNGGFAKQEGRPEGFAGNGSQGRQHMGESGRQNSRGSADISASTKEDTSSASGMVQTAESASD